MKSGKWLSLGALALLFGSLTVFFLFPQYEYISKLIYLAIIGVCAYAYFRSRHTKAFLVCVFGMLFILMTLVNTQRVKNLELGVLLVAWIALAIWERFKRKRSE